MKFFYASAHTVRKMKAKCAG